MRLRDMAGWWAAKASAVSRHIVIGGVGQPVWTPRRFDRLADEGYTKNVVAYRCVDEIAKGIATTPILLYKRAADGKRTAINNHPVMDLLRRPNPTQSMARLMHELASFLVIAGNSYLEGVGPDTGPRAGQYLELWTKRPDRMKVVPGDFGVLGYEHEVNGQTKRWDVDILTQQSAIRHFKLFHPLNDWYGMSPIEAAAYSIDTHNKTSEWNKALLDNAARPDGVMTTERSLTDQQFNRLKQQITEKHQGAKNAGRPMLLENGLAWQQLSFSPKDMDFLNSKHTSARDICNAFGVPPMLLGIPGDNTYSNQREARLAFFDVTVTFYLRMIIDDLNSWLLAPYGDDTLELDFDLDNVPAMSLRQEQLFERAEKSNFLMFNEKRAMTGFDPVDGGDVLMVPGTLKTIDQVINPPEPPAPVIAAPEPAKEPGKPPAEPKEPKEPKSVELIRTMKSAREELDMSPEQFKLWLEGEGYAPDRAEFFAELSE